MVLFAPRGFRRSEVEKGREVFPRDTRGSLSLMVVLCQ